MEQSLEDLKMSKRLELDIKAEDAFWQVIHDPYLFPMMALNRLLIIVVLSKRNLAQAEKDKLEAAFQIAEKLRNKKMAVDAATTEQQVRNIVWEDTSGGRR